MATYRLFENDTPGNGNAEAGGIVLGMQFTVDEECDLTEIRYWQPSGGTVTTDDRTCAVYTTTSGTSGTKVVTDFDDTPSGSGWQTATLGSPFALSPGTTYVAAVLFPTGGYAATANYWTAGAGASGVTAGPVTAPPASSAAGNIQGGFATIGSMAFPGNTFNGGQYWVDVTVEVEDAPPEPGTWSTSLTLG